MNPEFVLADVVNLGSLDRGNNISGVCIGGLKAPLSIRCLGMYAVLPPPICIPPDNCPPLLPMLLYATLTDGLIPLGKSLIASQALSSDPSIMLVRELVSPTLSILLVWIDFGGSRRIFMLDPQPSAVPKDAFSVQPLTDE
jgi:hypothetical protein